MRKPYPQELRDGIVKVARSRPEGVTLEQVAADFGIHPMTLSKWLRQAAVDDGAGPGVTTTESAELREARKRMRQLEMENEALPRIWARRIPKRLDDQDVTGSADDRELRLRAGALLDALGSRPERDQLKRAMHDLGIPVD